MEGGDDEGMRAAAASPGKEATMEGRETRVHQGTACGRNMGEVPSLPHLPT